MARSLFITFEGPEGGGKTTQIGLLRSYLQSRGASVLVTRQPGGDPVGQQLRKIMLDVGREIVNPRAELLMMMADRAQSVETVIRPHLQQGGIVICDRFADSSVAYQGGGRGIEIDLIHWLNRFSTAELTPEITFLLDIDPGIGLGRQSHKTKMELEDPSFHDRVRKTYHDLAAANRTRFVMIDASQSIPEVHKAIVSAVDRIWVG